VKVNPFEFREVYSFQAIESGNIRYSVIFFDHHLFTLEVPERTSEEEMAEAVLWAVFNDKVRGEAEAYLSHE